MSPFRRGPLDVLMGRWTLDSSPSFVAMDLASRLFSPYDFGAAALNPLGDILQQAVADGATSRPPADKTLTQARRAVEKAAALPRGLED